MGAWGIGAFENDDALDWVYELQEVHGTALLVSTLNSATAGGYLESPDSSMALAAAEVVASLNGKPPADLPEEVVVWVREQEEPMSGNLLEMAKTAVMRISTGSELKDLWEESGSLAEWTGYITDLLRRLNAT